MSPLPFLAGVLATWRVTHLVTAEDGPFNIVARLRAAAGGGFVGQLMDCFYCASVWVAAPIACWVAHGWSDRVVTWLALSAGAILVERFIPGRHDGAT